MAAAAKLRIRKAFISPERSLNRWIALDWGGLASHVTFLQRVKFSDMGENSGLQV